MKPKQLKIGFLALFFDLYLMGGDALLVSSREFAAEVAEMLGEQAAVVDPGVCVNRTEIESAIALFEAEDVDLIIVTHLTYAPSMYAAPALQKTRLPVLLYHTQKLKAITDAIVAWDLEENHGVHGMQDLASVLRRIGSQYFVVAGDNESAREELSQWLRAAQLKKYLSGSRIGLIGHPMESMGDFGVDETAFEAQMGTHIQHLSMKALAAAAENAPEDEIKAQMEFDLAHFEPHNSVSSVRHEAASRLEWALRDTLERERCMGFASHFLTIVQEEILDTLPFLAASKLMAEGYSFGGEGDVTSAVGVSLMQQLGGEANFTEIFSVDYGGEALFMSHMGEGNWRLARKDSSIQIRSDPFDIGALRVDPVSLVFSLKPGSATLLNITTGPNGKIQWIVTEGEVVDSPALPNLTLVHNRFKPEMPVREFLRIYSELGGSHHLALAYGNWKGNLAKLARLMNVEFYEI
jgi:L-arabinose isomerase